MDVVCVYCVAGPEWPEGYVKPLGEGCDAAEKAAAEKLATPPTLAEACAVIRIYRHLSAESSLDGVRAADKLADEFLARVKP
jgi:hypothetical protein